MSRLRPMSCRRLTSAFIVISLVLTACGGGESEDLDLAGDQEPIDITTLPPGPASLADQVEPPELETSGEDFDTIMRSIHQFEQWLLGHPDSPLGTEIYQPNSLAATAAFTVLVDSVQRGVITRVEGSEILSVEVVDQPDDDTVDLVYTDTRVATEQVDLETGEVVSRQDYEGEEFTFEARLRRGFDGKWRVETVARVAEE